MTWHLFLDARCGPGLVTLLWDFWKPIFWHWNVETCEGKFARRAPTLLRQNGNQPRVVILHAVLHTSTYNKQYNQYLCIYKAQQTLKQVLLMDLDPWTLQMGSNGTGNDFPGWWMLLDLGYSNTWRLIWVLYWRNFPYLHELQYERTRGQRPARRVVNALDGFHNFVAFFRKTLGPTPNVTHSSSVHVRVRRQLLAFNPFRLSTQPLLCSLHGDFSPIFME